MQPIKLPKPAKDDRFSNIDPLDSRYFDAEIAKHLSERTRIAYQAYVEAALAQTLADLGVCSSEDAQKIETAAWQVTAEQVYEEEKNTKHDIKALVNVIKKNSGEAANYVHFGATSNDIISTALSLQIRDAVNSLIVPRLKELLGTLIELTEKYADTPQIGRTHGQHAVPITFGFAVVEYVSRLGKSSTSLEVLSGKLVGKFSGAVGAYNALSLFVDDPLEFERKLLAKLDLEPAEYSTQIIPPENLVRLIDELAITAGIMANLANDMRHLQRTEIAEVHEKFEQGQVGSSTMAHKRNPANFENVVSLSKQVLAQIVNANLNLSSEHQRDLTDSASSRFYTIPLAAVAVMASRLNSAMSKIEVDEANMTKNLNLSGGAIAAEPLYLLLAKYGHPAAHEKTKELAHSALDQKKPLVEVISEDSEISEYWNKFSEAERQIITDPAQHYLGQAVAKAHDVASYWKSKLS